MGSLLLPPLGTEPTEMPQIPRKRRVMQRIARRKMFCHPQREAEGVVDEVWEGHEVEEAGVEAEAGEEAEGEQNLQEVRRTRARRRKRR